MDKEQQIKLGTAPVGPLLFKLALPTITAQLVNVLYNIVDRMYIGHIPENGASALTGLGVCFPVIVIVTAMASLAAAGGAPRAAIMMGQGKGCEAEKILGNCTAGLIIIGLASTLLLLLAGKPLLMLFGASENTLEYAWDYLWIYALGTIFVMISLGLNTFITAQGFTKISMMSVIIGAVCNVILDPVFIFAMNMGIRGAAVATVISQAVSALWVLRFLTGKKTMLRIRKELLRIDKKIYLPCLLLGLSPFVMQATEGIITICFNSSLLKYGGDIAVGAMTILSSVMQFTLLPVQGLTQGAQPIMSFNYGAGNTERVKKAFKILLAICLAYSAVISFTAIVFPQLFTNIFTSNAALSLYAQKALRIYMIGMVIFGIQIACQQTFVALGNAKSSLFLAVFRKILVLIPLIYIMPALFEPEDMAVFAAEPVADILAVLMTSTLFALQFRKMLYKDQSVLR